MRSNSIVLGFALVCACEMFHEDRGAASNTGTNERLAPDADARNLDLAALDLPKQPPFLGSEEVDAHGYPRSQPDQLALLNLLRLRRFDDLDRFMTYYQTEFEADFHKEYWPDTALAAFFTHEPKLERLLDEWVAQKPDSFAASAAQANYQWQQALSAEGMNGVEALEHAKVGFERAVQLRPGYVAARRRLIYIANALAEPEQAKAQLDAALESCPDCYIPRAYYLDTLEPPRGGSWEQMQAFVDETQALVERNPRLAWLAGFADSTRCNIEMRNKHYELAEAACEKALAVGDEPRFLIDAAHVYYFEEQYPKAVPLLDRVLAIEPLNERALETRYLSRLKLEDHLGAGRDLFALQHLDPLGPRTPERVKNMVDTLRYEGQELNKAGKYVEAAEYFSLGLLLAPNDEDLMKREAWNQKSIGFDDAQAQLAASPDDYALHLRIDHGLAASGRFVDVVKIWDTFIAAHEDDPRPYAERGGAKWQLGQRDEAITDMTHACRRGLASACDDVAQMRARAKR